MNVCVENSLDYDRISFAQLISKFIFGDSLDMDNFHISQVKFKMSILNWIIIKIFYQKPQNWVRANDFDSYLMQELLFCKYINWVKFIIYRIFHYKKTTNRYVFFTLFSHMILELNSIMSEVVDLLEALKCWKNLLSS